MHIVFNKVKPRTSAKPQGRMVPPRCDRLRAFLVLRSGRKKVRQHLATIPVRPSTSETSAFIARATAVIDEHAPTAEQRAQLVARLHAVLGGLPVAPQPSP